MKSRFVVLVSVASILMVAAPVFAQSKVPMIGSGDVTSDAPPAEKAVFLAQYDDGESDAGLTDSGKATSELVMLFDGVGGPEVTLGGVDICLFSTGADSMIRYEIVIFDDDGAGGSPGTELLTVAAEASGVGFSPEFDTTSLGIPLTDSDVYIGVRWNPVVDPNFAFCSDFDGIGGEVQPGYWRDNEDGAWTSISSAYDSDYNAMMFRAFFSTPPPNPDIQIVPLFEVDTSSVSGTTTLFAVRNLTGSSRGVDITYYTVDGLEQRSDFINLDARETHTVNVRDVAGLDTDPDGFKRGYIEVFGIADTDGSPTFAGDFFQVDVGDDFATGERMRRLSEACEVESLRFLEFALPGSGTEITVWLQFPQGTGAGDPSSLVVRRYDEAGNFLGTTSFKTNDHVLQISASDLAAVPFGTFELDFGNSGRGFGYAESATQGRFSVGVDSQCEIP